MDKLAKLICGDDNNLGKLSDILIHLQKQITFYSSKSIESFTQQDEKVITNIVPYYARVILELSLTALIGRIDPFRLLIVEKIQSGPGYEVGKKIESAILWSGDIISEKKPESLDYKFKLAEINRAVLAGHIATVFWEPAFESASDSLCNDSYQSEWITTLLQISSSRGVCTYFRDPLQTLYSTLSKGVHQEFLMASPTQDVATVKENLVKVFKYLSQLGLLSHFVPAIHAKIDQGNAIELVKEVEIQLKNIGRVSN